MKIHTWRIEGWVMKMQMSLILLVGLNSAHLVTKKYELVGPYQGNIECGN